MLKNIKILLALLLSSPYLFALDLSDQLMQAIEIGDINLTGQLIEQDAPINNKDKNNATPLMVATECYLRALNALSILEPNSKDIALFSKARDRRVEIIRLLLAANANPNVKNRHDTSGFLQSTPLEIIKYDILVTAQDEVLALFYAYTTKQVLIGQ